MERLEQQKIIVPNETFLSEWINETRQNQNVTQQQLADHIGTRQHAVSYFFTAKTFPMKRAILALDYLGYELVIQKKEN